MKQYEALDTILDATFHDIGRVVISVPKDHTPDRGSYLSREINREKDRVTVRVQRGAKARTFTISVDEVEV